MNKHFTKLAWTAAAALILSPAGALAQADGVAAGKAKKGDDPSAAEAQAQSDQIAAMAATQAKMAEELAQMQEKVSAAETAAQSAQDLERLTEEVETLNKKVEELTAASEAKTRAMQQEIDAQKPTKGFTIKGPGDSSLTIGGLLQARIEGAKEKAPNGDNWDFDTYLRRIRLMFFGQLNKWVNFFIETDNPNFGKSGDWSPSTFIQDAYLELNIHEAFQIDVGMLLLPFSHQGMQGATTLFGMDYHTALIKYPGGGHKVWRDAGLMLRGLFAGQHVEYRFGIFNGVHGGLLALRPNDPADPRNPKDLPRLTGRLTFNVFDAEGGAGAGGFFYDGLYLSKTDAGVISPKRVLSFGSSVDWQPDLNVQIGDPSLLPQPPEGEGPAPYAVEKRTDYIAGAWDAFWDIPLGARKLMSLNGQLNLYYYYYGDRSAGADNAGDATAFWYYDAAKDKTSYTGFGLSSELGFRYNTFQPLVLIDFFNATQTDDNKGDYLAIAGGFNYYLFAHNTTFKLQVGADQAAKSDEWGVSAGLQAQLLF